MYFLTDSYKEQLLKNNIFPLSMRREQNDIIVFWKCLNGKYEVYILKYVFFQTTLTGVPAARQMKDSSRKCLFVKPSVLERAI